MRAYLVCTVGSDPGAIQAVQLEALTFEFLLGSKKPGVILNTKLFSVNNGNR